MVVFMLYLEFRFIDHTAREFIVARLPGRELKKLIMDLLTGRGDVQPCLRIRGPRGGGGSHGEDEQRPLSCGPE